jgi:hypothetical protein
LAYLDAQLNDTLRMKDRLENWARTMDTARKQMAEFFSSPEGARQMELAFLQGSRLVAMLADCNAHSTPDGWALLSTAPH